MQACKRIGRFAAAVAAVVAVLFGVAVTPAAAGTFESWRFKTGAICVNDHGWVRWPTTTAVAAWDTATDIRLVRSADCAGYPRTQVAYLTTYNDPSDNACAKTASSSGYTWEYVYFADGTRKAVWTPKSMTIWMNMASNLYSRCHATAELRAHVIAHEIGHAIGLGHPPAGSPSSVMGAYSWSVRSPTSFDLANVNKAY